MSKAAEAKGLLAVALDADRPAKERLAALLKANDLRAEMKVGWAKLTEDGQPLNYAALLADAQDAAEEASTLRQEPPKPEPKASKAKPAAKAKAPKKPKDEERGKISALVRKVLLETDLPYDKIVERVLKAHPNAKTTARSVASVASDLRRAGQTVAMRRVEASAS